MKITCLVAVSFVSSEINEIVIVAVLSYKFCQRRAIFWRKLLPVYDEKNELPMVILLTSTAQSGDILLSLAPDTQVSSYCPGESASSPGESTEVGHCGGKRRFACCYRAGELARFLFHPPHLMNRAQRNLAAVVKYWIKQSYSSRVLVRTPNFFRKWICDFGNEKFRVNFLFF